MILVQCTTFTNINMAWLRICDCLNAGCPFQSSCRHRLFCDSVGMWDLSEVMGLLKELCVSPSEVRLFHWLQNGYSFCPFFTGLIIVIYLVIKWPEDLLTLATILPWIFQPLGTWAQIYFFVRSKATGILSEEQEIGDNRIAAEQCSCISLDIVKHLIFNIHTDGYT